MPSRNHRQQPLLLLPISGIVLAVLVGCAAAAPEVAPPSSAATSPTWSYVGEDGPDRWSEIAPACGDLPDSVESPIDLRTDGFVVDAEAPPITFSYRSLGFTLENNGHTIEAIPVDLMADVVTVDGVDYFLQQFHLHASSEHLVDGVAADAELHLVHKSAKGEILVLGVFLNAGEASGALSELFSRIPEEAAEAPPEALKESIDLTEVIPVGSARAQYMGSLTTPPCTEGVKWEVLLTPSAISAEQLSLFTAVYPDNHRPVQSLHGRTVTVIPAG